MELVVKIYQLTDLYPRSEMFGLVSQMRRCAVSLPSNIAEGAARDSRKEFGRFLYIARGSLAELQTQLIVSERTGLIQADETLEKEIGRINALLQGLIRKTVS